MGYSAACVATHPSDLAVALAVLDAVVRVEGEAGPRRVPLSGLYRPPGDDPRRDTVLEHADLITGIEVPPAGTSRSRYRKVTDRGSFAFAVVSVAVALDLDGGLVLEEWRRPVGVIGANFEARPNVTVDVASQLIKSHNAGVLRTGSAALASAAILVIIGFTSVFNRAMVLEQVPQGIAEFAAAQTDSAWVFLVVVNLVLLLVGMFMETNAATLLMGPLLAPAAIKFGIDPVHFGIVLVTNIELGLLTPPLATNLFVAARANDARLTQMMPYVPWFMAAALFVLLLITFVPGISLWYRFF